MATQENIWGSEFGEYSTQSFEPQLATLSDAEIENFRGKHKVLPLEYLGNVLRRCDPRDDTFSELVALPLVDTITALWEYIDESNSNALTHYYGFLCVRQLLYATSMAILKDANAVDKVVSSLRPGASWSDWAQAVAFEALDITAQAMRDPVSFKGFCETFTQSPTFASNSVSGSRANTPLLTTALWKSRDSFLTLCSCGLLPGSALLLLALLNLLSTHPDRERSTRTQLIFLQDLGFRLYLVGSHRDRQILHYVCMSATQNDINWTNGSNRVASPEDSRTIAEAYIGLFLVSQQGFNIESFPIDFMGHLAGFVLHVAGWNPSATTNEMIDTAYVTLQFLWLLLEDRGRIPVEDHHKVRFYATSIFGFFGYLQRKRISTRAMQHRFAEMLAKAEIVALIGRILLLVLEDGNEFKNLELLDQTIEEMSELEDPIDKSAAVAPELFLDSKIEWAKVSVRFGAFIEMKSVQLSEENVRYLLGMCDAWQRYTGVRRDYNDALRKCIYPRCSQLSLTESKLIVHNVCGRCKEAVYCDSTCQSAHWELAASESHRLKCRPLVG